MKSSSKYSDFIEYLQAGKICLFETDTVVGIGCKIMCDGKINSNIEKIFNIKKRNSNKTFPWLISSEKMLNEYATNINDFSKNLINEKWPGATTLIFEAKDRIPQEFSVKVDDKTRSLAFRIPDCEELINAIDFVSCPVATTSANISGKAPVFDINDVDNKLLERVDFVFTKHFHKTKNNQASQIISCLEKDPKILRN